MVLALDQKRERIIIRHKIAVFASLILPKITLESDAGKFEQLGGDDALE